MIFKLRQLYNPKVDPLQYSTPKIAAKYRILRLQQQLIIIAYEKKSGVNNSSFLQKTVTHPYRQWRQCRYSSSIKYSKRSVSTDIFRLNKEMHNSQLNSETSSRKEKQHHFDLHDSFDVPEETNQRITNKSISQRPQETDPRQPLQSFYQSDGLSSQPSNSQTKSHKKFGVSPYTLSEKMIKRGASNSNKGEQKFLFINSKKQKYNNNFMFLSDIDALKQQIRKYEISIDKLKQQNIRLRSEKIKLCSSNESMQLIELRLQLEDQKNRVKQLETERELQITVANRTQQSQNISANSSTQKSNNSSNPSQSYIASSRLEAVSKAQIKEAEQQINAPTFRSNQQMDQNKIQPTVLSVIDSPRVSPTVTNQSNETNNSPIPNTKNKQILKSPYFLKKI